MTMKYRIVIGDFLSKEKTQVVEQIIQNTFTEINAVYNKWNPDSEISKLNNLKAGETAPLSPELERFLLQTQQIVSLTEGRFDPTIEPLQHLWKDKLAQKQIPNDAEIKAIIPALGWDKIHFHEGFFFKDHALTQLDLGGIAKGYCVDLLVERLNATGLPNVFVEWGGEIRTSGQHPDQRPWRIFISHLGDTNQKNAIATLDLNNQAIATSGDYLQFWTIDEERILDDNIANKKTYFHIFNPETHRPLEITSQSIASVSVLAPSCLLADGLATAAMMFPSQTDAEAWLEQIKQKFPKLEFWVVVRKG
jgi:thiamine biosynthesis lipoprotein